MALCRSLTCVTIIINIIIICNNAILYVQSTSKMLQKLYPCIITMCNNFSVLDLVLNGNINNAESLTHCLLI